MPTPPLVHACITGHRLPEIGNRCRKALERQQPLCSALQPTLGKCVQSTRLPAMSLNPRQAIHAVHKSHSKELRLYVVLLRSCRTSISALYRSTSEGPRTRNTRSASSSLSSYRNRTSGVRRSRTLWPIRRRTYLTGFREGVAGRYCRRRGENTHRSCTWRNKTGLFTEFVDDFKGVYYTPLKSSTN